MSWRHEPKRETTETRRCSDCDEDTTHLVIEWSFNTTTECRECGFIRDMGEL